MSAGVRSRLDSELVRRGLTASRTEAHAAIRGGLVTVAGKPAMKPSMMVAPGEPLKVSGETRPFVSRGGEKLAGALDAFSLDPTGRDCLDAGASTGGFTDCLLSRAAARVIAVDVGYGQLAWSLRTDDRVTTMERTNVRDLSPEDLPFRPSFVVADCSFISLRTIVPALVRCAASDADFVALVKPQFEAGPSRVGKGGVVRDPIVWREAIEGAVEAFAVQEVPSIAVAASALKGPAGNVEFFLFASTLRPPVPESTPPPEGAAGFGMIRRQIDRAIRIGEELGGQS